MHHELQPCMLNSLSRERGGGGGLLKKKKSPLPALYPNGSNMGYENRIVIFEGKLGSELIDLKESGRLFHKLGAA